MMENINKVLSEIGVSKVRLAKYLGVSRQMLYNYISLPTLAEWPKEKSVKLLSLLNVSSEEELSKLEVTGEYILDVESRLNEGVTNSADKEVLADLRGLNKKEQEILSDIINL